MWFPTRANLNDQEDLKLNLVNGMDVKVYRQFLLRLAGNKSLSCKDLKYNLRSLIPKRVLSCEAKRKIANSKAVLQKYLDGLGILSLSDRENDPLLWKTYGDKGAGVCIILKMECSEYLLKVEYKTPRPELKLSELLLSADAKGEIIKVLKTKTKKWAYESEWRCFVPNGNKEVLIPEIHGKIDAIKLGENMRDAEREMILKWLKTAQRQIRIEY